VNDWPIAAYRWTNQVKSAVWPTSWQLSGADFKST